MGTFQRANAFVMRGTISRPDGNGGTQDIDWVQASEYDALVSAIGRLRLESKIVCAIGGMIVIALAWRLAVHKWEAR